MQKCSIIFALMVIVSIVITATAFGLGIVQFKQPIQISVGVGYKVDTLWVGVNSGIINGNDTIVPPSTYGQDLGTEMGPTGEWKELLSPGVPKSYSFYPVFVEIPSRAATPPVWASIMKPYDFRGYTATNQIDTFQFTVQPGDSLLDGFPETGITFRWRPTISGNAETWQLFRRTKNTVPYIYTQLIDNLATSGTSFDDDGVAGSSNKFTYLLIKTGAHNAPLAPPVLVSPANAEEGVVRKPTMVWSSSTSPAIYHLQIYQQGIQEEDEPDILVVNEFNIATTSFEVSVLLLETRYYYWRVEITDGAGNSISPYSTVFGFTTGSEVPVEMTSFTASVEGLNAMLCWKTATEVNNYGFEIERRAIPAGIWNKIGFVAGAGTSNKPCEYAYTDKNLEAGKYTYRIKQVDNDGTFKYSSSAEIQVLGMPSVLKLDGNYPNPFNPNTTIQFTVPQNGFTRLRIYNVIGQEVANLFNGPAEVGKLNIVKFEASSLPSGLYFSVLEFGSQRLTSKMVLLK
jgi:hypothetical protein